ncbi:MAG: VanZ family protein [Bacteroidia bacterium]|nr:VanZ family protein [Bacteroidia bacterium]
MIFKNFRFSLFIILFILILSILPYNRNSEKTTTILFIAADKLEHFIAYFVLSVVILLENKRISSRSQKIKHDILITVLVTLFFGILVEILQKIITVIHRSGNIRDVIANSTGIITGVIFFSIFGNSLNTIIEKVFTKYSGNKLRKE